VIRWFVVTSLVISSHQLILVSGIMNNIYQCRSTTSSRAPRQRGSHHFICPHRTSAIHSWTLDLPGQVLAQHRFSLGVSRLAPQPIRLHACGYAVERTSPSSRCKSDDMSCPVYTSNKDSVVSKGVSDGGRSHREVNIFWGVHGPPGFEA